MLGRLNELYGMQEGKKQLAGRVFDLFKETGNTALSYYNNENLCHMICDFIAENVSPAANLEKILSTIKQILVKYDFRIVSDYLRALQQQDPDY